MFHCNGWGMPYAVTGDGRRRHIVLRKVDGEEILRASSGEGVTLLCGAPAVVAAILDAAARARPPRAGPCPGRGTVRIVVAGAPPPSQDHRAGRDRARLGVHPDLRADRDVAAAHHQPGPGRVGRRSSPAERAQLPQPGRRARRRRADRRRRRRRGAGPLQPRLRRLLGAARGDGGRARRRLVPHRRRRLPRRTPTSSSPTARRTSSSPAARTSPPSRSRTASTSTRRWPRWRSSACPTRSGARRSRRWSCCREGASVTEAELIEHCRDRLAHFKSPTASSSARRSTARRPASSRSTSCASPTGPDATDSQLRSGPSPRPCRAGDAGPVASFLEEQPAVGSKAAATLAVHETADGLAGDGLAPAVVEPAGLAAEELGDVGPGGQQALVEGQVVGDLADQPAADGHRGRRGAGLPAVGRHADLGRR